MPTLQGDFPWCAFLKPASKATAHHNGGIPLACPEGDSRMFPCVGLNCPFCENRSTSFTLVLVVTMLYSDMLIHFTSHAKLLTTKGTGQPCCIHLETQRWSEKDAEYVMTSHIPCDVITCVMMSSQTTILDLVIWGQPSWIWPYGGSHLVGGHHGSGHMGAAILDLLIWRQPFWICPYGGGHLGSAHMEAAILDLPIWERPFWICSYGGSHF